MPRIPVCLALIALGTTLGAQDAGPKQAVDASAQFNKLQTEFRKASADWRRQQWEAARKNPRLPIRMVPTEIIHEFIPKFADAARQHAGTDAAIPFLTWLLTADRAPNNPHSKAALATLLSDHVTSAKLADAAASIPALGRTLGTRVVDDAIAKILAKNPHGLVKARIYYTRASVVLRAQKVSKEAKAAALADMRKCIDLAPESDFASRAKGVLYEQEKLQIGMPVPDIEGEDLDGVAFRLSDYKGKVIMLDFWGDW